MASYREIRNLFLLSFAEDVIDATDFALLYDVNTSHNPDFPYWNYDQFDLENMSDAECKAEFRFYKNDIITLVDLLHFPEKISCCNRSKVGKVEGFCIFLKIFVYAYRYGDMISRFGRSVPELSMVSNSILNSLYSFKNESLRLLQYDRIL